MELERLQKIMASCGVASRRASEKLILDGKVSVNGKVITELGFKASYKDEIVVNGKLINKEEKVYYLLNKPTGYLTTVSDPKGRRTIMDLLSEETKEKRVFPIGRLDYDTSGALLITNDGELSNRLLKSKNEIEKVYQIRADGKLEQGHVIRLMKGIMIDGIMTKRAKVEPISYDKEHNSSLFRLTITEGRNRQVRRMCEIIGLPVKKLKRISFSGISIDGLGTGQYRALKPHEVKKLYSL